MKYAENKIYIFLKYFSLSVILSKPLFKDGNARNSIFKGTVSVILSKPLFKDGNETVPLKFCLKSIN